MTPMPKLSEDLDGPRHPERCQGCGRECDLAAWLEHDERDRPTAVVVILCLWCSESLIEPHPRLYDERPAHEPRPGTMGLCVDCSHRDGVSCRSPLLKANGGPGLRVDHPTPDRGHIDYRDKAGRRAGQSYVRYRGPATACSGQLVETMDITRRQA